MPKSSHTTTFELLLHHPVLQTLAEFSSLPKPRMKRFEMQINLFTHMLVKFLLPTEATEAQNFIPYLQVIKTKSNQITTKPIHLSTSRLLNFPEKWKSQHFFLKNTHNFAQLILLNTIFGAEEAYEHFEVHVSASSGKLFFSQGYKKYWLNYFDEGYERDMLFQDDQIPQKLRDILGLDALDDLVEQLFPELCILYLRLSLTPWSLIQALCVYYTHKFDLEEIKTFLTFLKSNIDECLQYFKKILVSSYKDEFQLFISQNAPEHFRTFQNDMEMFVKTAPFLKEEIKESLFYDSLQMAMKMNIKGLEHCCLPINLKYMPRKYHLTCFDYLHQAALGNWSNMKANKEHVLWTELEAISQFLLRQCLPGQIKHDDCSLHLFLVAISYHYNHLANFFIEKAHAIKSSRINSVDASAPTDRMLLHKSPLTIALEHQNYAIAEKLREQIHDLLHSEIKIIQMILRNCIIRQDERCFENTIPFCTKILRVQDFLHQLRGECEEHAPDFLKYLPPLIPAPRAISLLGVHYQQDSDSSSSTSSGDEYRIQSPKPLRIRGRLFHKEPHEPATVSEILERFPSLHLA